MPGARKEEGRFGKKSVTSRPNSAWDMKKLILWDLDGTLIDTLEDLADAVNHALKLRALPLHGIDEYRKMGVASNKFQEGTEHLIKEFFPDIQFVAILGNRPGQPLKPDPAIVEEVLSKGNIGPEEAVMVGDSPTDMRTAANGGIGAIAVSWGYRTKEELAGNRMADTVEQLREQLGGCYVSEPISTPPFQFETRLQQLVYETFASKDIPFSRVDTDPGITMEDCQNIDAKIGIHIVKTIFLCNRQQTEFYLYVTSDDKPSPALSSSVRGTCWTSIWKGGS